MTPDVHFQCVSAYLDVEIHHLEIYEALKFSNISVVAQGPLYGAVRAEVKYGQSTISVTVSHSARFPLNLVLKQPSNILDLSFGDTGNHHGTLALVLQFRCGCGLAPAP